MRLLPYGAKTRVYAALPSWGQAAIGAIPFASIAGKGYRQVRRTGTWMDRASRAEVVAYQEARLGRLLEFATAQVPFYRGLTAVVSTNPPFQALRRFPLVDKATLQERLDEFLPSDFAKIPHYEATTGGTTGNQLRLYLDDASQAVEMAFMHRLWSRVGYSPRCRKATFRGVQFPHLPKGIYWQRNPIYNELQFSPFHMSDSTLGLYLAALEAYQPAFLHGYPSAIALLAEYAVRTRFSPTRLSLKAALLASEGVEEGQRELIERAFGARPFSWYGHSERVILGGECEVSSVYHHFPDYGVLEVVNEGGEPARAGERGELVGTGLLNWSMPLIRYRTEDRARLLEPACECGRAFDRFDQVEGRWKQEYLVGRNGSRISVASLNMHGPAFERVSRYQYHQRREGEMELRVMVAPGFDNGDIKRLRDAYRSKVGSELDVRVVVVDDIPLTPRGKLQRLMHDTPPASRQVATDSRPFATTCDPPLSRDDACFK